MYMYLLCLSRVLSAVWQISRLGETELIITINMDMRISANHSFMQCTISCSVAVSSSPDPKFDVK